jgi:hypothetical protein
MRHARIIAACFALAMMSPALAQDAWMAPLKPADRTRIQNVAASREKAVVLAAAGNAAELRAVKELLGVPSQPLDPQALDGSWRCRTFKVGGDPPLSTTPFFACRIVREGRTLFLEKISGSIRRKARLDPIDGKRMLMFGAYWAGGEKAAPYGVDDYRDEVGILERLGANRLRVELPEPRAFSEARHEIIELLRPRSPL